MKTFRVITCLLGLTNSAHAEDVAAFVLQPSGTYTKTVQAISAEESTVDLFATPDITCSLQTKDHGGRILCTVSGVDFGIIVDCSKADRRTAFMYMGKRALALNCQAND